MNKTSYNAIVLLITFLLFGCATGTDTAPADSDQGLRQYLREAVTDDAQRESLHLLVRCTGEEIYGGRAALATQKRKEEPGACCPMQVVCNVELSFAGGTKRVAQLAKGDQSEQMRQLAEDLLDACEKPGKAGTTADDLTDALEKVAGGILAPETVRVLLHHKPEAVAAAGDAGFLLRVSGGIATSRSYDAEGRLQDAVSLRLSSAEIAALARELAGASLAKLPVNLFAPDYKDLSVEVLNYKQSVTARRFADMTPTTRAEFQAGFQRIYDFLYKLHAQVLSQGKPARDAG